MRDSDVTEGGVAMGGMPGSAAETAIAVHGLRVAFNGREVLRGVDLSIAARRATVCIGRSGSGKTTFLRALNRLNECFPLCRTQGAVRVRLDGVMQDAYAPQVCVEALRRRVGMVFQTPNVLPVSIERNMTLPLRLVLGERGAACAGRMEAALGEAGLWDEVRDRLRDPALSLSGGQQQRLCLARALALQPDVLLLDEPTASLDFQAAQRIEDLLLRLRERYTLVVVSHSLRQARRLADTLAVFRDGACAQVLDRAALDHGGPVLEMVEEAF
ncbi:MAG: phosphate ABC transporter ATP-binding protein [Desulfovibrionaceae bacterium]